MGTSKSAGIPNITGQIGNIMFGGTSASDGTNAQASGAISYKGSLRIGSYSADAGSGANIGNYGLEFDANDVSNVYSSTVTTVQPSSLCLNYLIKYI